MTKNQSQKSQYPTPKNDLTPGGQFAAVTGGHFDREAFYI